jgi:hypothetical protein
MLKLRIVVALLTAGLGSAVLEAQSNPSAVWTGCWAPARTGRT